MTRRGLFLNFNPDDHVLQKLSKEARSQNRKKFWLSTIRSIPKSEIENSILPPFLLVEKDGVQYAATVHQRKGNRVEVSNPQN